MNHQPPAVSSPVTPRRFIMKTIALTLVCIAITMALTGFSHLQTEYDKANAEYVRQEKLWYELEEKGTATKWERSKAWKALVDASKRRSETKVDLILSKPRGEPDPKLFLPPAPDNVNSKAKTKPAVSLPPEIFAATKAKVKPQPEEKATRIDYDKIFMWCFFGVIFVAIASGFIFLVWFLVTVMLGIARWAKKQ